MKSSAPAGKRDPTGVKLSAGSEFVSQPHLHDSIVGYLRKSLARRRSCSENLSKRRIIDVSTEIGLPGEPHRITCETHSVSEVKNLPPELQAVILDWHSEGLSNRDVYSEEAAAANRIACPRFTCARVAEEREDLVLIATERRREI